MQRKNYRLGARLLVAVSALCLLLWSAVFAYRENHFDRQKWLANSHRGDDQDNPRLKMLDDILRNRLSPGMPLAQATNLLGEPDYKTHNLPPFKCQAADASRCLNQAEAARTAVVTVYGLGMPYMDPVALCVSFDKSGKLVKAWQFSH